MFVPNYTMTPQLLSTIQEIERLYGRLEGLTVPQSLLLNLERDNLIQSSFSSNSIEGNPLSQAEVTNLLLDDRVPVNRSEKEIVNYFKILKSLPTMVNKPLNLSVLLELHAHLLSGVNDSIKGHIRNIPIVVGKRTGGGELFIKHNPPFHEEGKIEQALLETMNWLNASKDSPLLKTGIFHHQFVYIHPFEDGNGRMTRLLTALILLKHKYAVNKYFVLDDYYDIDRQGYSDALHSADNGDTTQWLEYFTEGVKYSLQGALGRIESGVANLGFDLRPSPREQEALEVIKKYREVNSGDLVKELDISRQQAFNLLKALVEKGYIEKRGQTKSSFYVLK